MTADIASVAWDRVVESNHLFGVKDGGSCRWIRLREHVDRSIPSCNIFPFTRMLLSALEFPLIANVQRRLNGREDDVIDALTAPYGVLSLRWCHGAMFVAHALYKCAPLSRLL